MLFAPIVQLFFFITMNFSSKITSTLSHGLLLCYDVDYFCDYLLVSFLTYSRLTSFQYFGDPKAGGVIVPSLGPLPARGRFMVARGELLKLNQIKNIYVDFYFSLN